MRYRAARRATAMSTKRRENAGWYEYPQYYDMAFRDETAQETAFIEAACAKYVGFPVRRMLEPACGTGRLVVALAESGYDLTGFDIRSEPLAYLRRKLARRGLSAKLFLGDMREFQLDGPVDAAFNTWNSFRYLLSESDAHQHLQCIANCLRPGGIYILAMHLLPLDVSEECTERWTARHGRIRATYTLRVLATDRRRRRETLRISVLVRNGDRELRLRDDFQFRMYTASQFRRLLAGVPQLELCDVYDFWYEIEQPQRLDDEITDTVFILRRKE